MQTSFTYGLHTEKQRWKLLSEIRHKKHGVNYVLLLISSMAFDVIRYAIDPVNTTKKRKYEAIRDVFEVDYTAKKRRLYK